MSGSGCLVVLVWQDACTLGIERIEKRRHQHVTAHIRRHGSDDLRSKLWRGINIRKVACAIDIMVSHECTYTYTYTYTYALPKQTSPTSVLSSDLTVTVSVDSAFPSLSVRVALQPNAYSPSSNTVRGYTLSSSRPVRRMRSFCTAVNEPDARRDGGGGRGRDKRGACRNVNHPVPVPQLTSRVAVPVVWAAVKVSAEREPARHIEIEHKGGLCGLDRRFTGRLKAPAGISPEICGGASEIHSRSMSISNEW